jgi:hypothetical protein
MIPKLNDLMLTRIIIIYIAVAFRIQCTIHSVDIGLPGRQLGDLCLLAQTGRNQHQPEQLENAVGDECHEGGGNGTGEDGGHVIQ